MIDSAREHRPDRERIDDDVETRRCEHEDPMTQYSALLVSDTDVNDLALRKAPPRYRVIALKYIAR